MAIEKSNGITFKYSDDGGSTMTTLGQLVDITVPTISKDSIEVTNHGSAGHREFMGGLVDMGEATVVVQYDGGKDGGASADAQGHTGLRALAATAYEATPTANVFEINFPDGDKQEFKGIVTGFEMGTPVDEIITATFTIKVSGAVTYTDDDS
tara:strand:- start:868 stop:1326 length:459 start_codon:yes stop_codon:yes gene_type:complete